MKRMTWAWVSRNEDSEYNAVLVLWSGRSKPSLRACEHEGLINREAVLICSREFERVTGLAIKPGTCQKVQFTAKVIK